MHAASAVITASGMITPSAASPAGASPAGGASPSAASSLGATAAAAGNKQQQQKEPARPRRFTIQSQFGQARRPRSRKNRPCDVCRRRKTACVIPHEPPCLFCKSRGLECQSFSSSSGLTPRVKNDHSYRSIDGGLRRGSKTSPGVARGLGLGVGVGVGVGPEQQPGGIGIGIGTGMKRQPSASAVVHQGLMDHHHHHSADGGLDPRSSSSSAAAASASAAAAAAAAAAGLAAAAMPPLTTPLTDPFSPPTPRDLDQRQPPLYTLEDNPGQTAHLVGPSGEQDTYLLDAFRCLILGENQRIDANIIQVHAGGARADDRPVHFLLLRDAGPASAAQAKEAAASDAIETLVWPYCENLVRLFFKHVHPVYPVVTKARFLRAYAAAKMKIPASLRAAVYATACAFWARDPALADRCRPFRTHQLVDHAHDALRRDHDSPSLFSLQACLLLHHVPAPDPDTAVETPALWTLTAQAVACAQTMGLHLDPARWSLRPCERRVRRRLWWAVFALDCWSSVCHGNPPHIPKSSYTTGPPDMDDVRADEDVPDELRHLVEPDDGHFQACLGARFLENIRISRMLREVLDCSFRVRPSEVPLAQREMELGALRDSFKDWHTLLPHCLSIAPEALLISNCPLHLAYYASRALLYRGLMTPANRSARTNAHSALRKWFVMALQEFQAFGAFIGQVTDMDLRGFWCRHARSQLVLCGNFLIYLFVLASEPPHIEAAYQLLVHFNQSVQSLDKKTHGAARMLLRPVRLRMDSFFIQAAQILVHVGGDGLGGGGGAGGVTVADSDGSGSQGTPAHGSSGSSMATPIASGGGGGGDGGGGGGGSSAAGGASFCAATAQEVVAVAVAATTACSASGFS